MSTINLYSESDEVISSDEYSDEDDLINEAINANTVKKSSSVNMSNKNNKYTLLKQKPRVNKIASIVKKRSVQWLNSKKKREKYKEIILKIVKENLYRKNISEDISSVSNVVIKESKHATNNTRGKKNDLGNTELKRSEEIEKKEDPAPILQSEVFLEKDMALHGIKHLKRSRSISPTLLKSDDARMETNITNNTLLCKEVNKLFPKYNNVIENFVRSSSKTPEGIEQKITHILMEIQALSDLIRTKELEWNKLLHIRKIKEEIIIHLTRKKNVMELKEKKISSNNCSDLKGFDLHTSSESSDLPTSAHSLVENRANMRKEDLDKEKPHINRLHSILISGNILHKTKSEEHDSSNICTVNRNQTKYCLQQEKATENSTKVVGRQGLFKDVKRIIADFREKNPDIVTERDRRIILQEECFGDRNSIETLNESNFSVPRRCIESVDMKFAPTLDTYMKDSKYASRFDKASKDVSIIPISHNHADQLQGRRSKRNLYQSSLILPRSNIPILADDEEDIIKMSRMRAADCKREFSENEVPLCQACKNNEARFVCAGCGNQWYCSRRCQVSAWDMHSDMCKE